MAPSSSLIEHIDRLWDVLTRPADAPGGAFSSRIAVPFPYLVPGGRFGESYYWDTYFTAEGLVASGRIDLLEHMIGNFANLIERYGHIPNSNRSYYLSRSQPPFFCCMLQLLEQARGTAAIVPFMPHLEQEYRFWMDHSTEANIHFRTVLAGQMALFGLLLRCLVYRSCSLFCVIVCRALMHEVN